MLSFGKIKGWGIAVAGICLVALAALPLFAKQLLFVESTSKSPDVIVVLGGDSGDRVFRCLEVFKTNKAQRIIISGTNDCYYIQDRLTLAGIPKDKILVEPRSRNTKENAEYSMKLIRERNYKKVVIVTSWYHSRRALACFQHFGNDVEFASLPAYHGINMEGKPSRGEGAFVFHEYIGLLWYAIRYGIVP